MAKQRKPLGLNDLTLVQTAKGAKVNSHVDENNCLVLIFSDGGRQLESRTFRTQWVQSDTDREPRQSEKFIDTDFLKDGEEYAIFEVFSK